MTRISKSKILLPVLCAVFSVSQAISEPIADSVGNRFGGKPISFNEHEPNSIGCVKIAENTAILQSTETDNGVTREKFSDGLVVKVDSSGNRNECLNSKHFVLETKVPDTYHMKSSEAVDIYIRTLINLGKIKGLNSSILQSRLFQYSSYYLSLGETSKAEPLVKEFFEIQNRIHEKGEPFTDAEKKYRLALKGSE